MAYSALTLITRAYHLSQIVARELQTVSGSQITDGLDLLNELLDIKGSDVRLIPYFSETIMNCVIGQEVYFLPNIYSIESITFNIGPVRFPMSYQSRDEYFGQGRVDNIQSLPFTWHLERVLDGSNLYIYYVPQDTYVLKIWGKVALTNVNLNTDLSLYYDRFYIAYLRYALAEYICSEFAQNFPEQAAMKYREIRAKLMDTSPPDLRMKKVSTLTHKPGLNWALCNIAGWVP